MPASQARTKRWTRLEYERLIELGAFGPEERLELIAGQLMVREPQGRRHSTGIRLVAGGVRAGLERRGPTAGRARRGVRARTRRRRCGRGASRLPRISPDASSARGGDCSHEPRPGSRRESQASMPGPGLRTTGSSIWWTTSWKCIGNLGPIRMHPMAGVTVRRRRFAAATS